MRIYGVYACMVAILLSLSTVSMAENQWGNRFYHHIPAGAFFSDLSNPQQPGVRSCGKHRGHHAAGIYRLLIAGYQYQSLYQ